MTDLLAIQREMQHSLRASLCEAPAWIVDAPPLTPAERLAVYGEAYFLRLDEALRSNFPKLHALLGDHAFAELSRRYVTAHPSRRRSLRWMGDQLVGWLSATQPYAQLPALAELAAWEWALGLAFDAADAPCLGMAALADFDETSWPTLRPQFHPSFQVVSLQWNATAIWQALDAGQPPPAPQQLAQSWAIWRQHMAPHYRSLASDEAALCLALWHGAAFADACETLLPWHNEDEAPLRAATLLGSWLGSGWICRLA